MGKSLTQAVEERGLSPEDFKTLRQVVWPNAQSDSSVMMALDYCRARGLDPFKRPVHVVPVWDKDAGRLVDTVRPGISELRTTAMRTGEYVGRDEVRFGPDTEYRLGSVSMTVPEYAQVTVYRLVAGRVVPFPGDPVYFLETYATKSARDSEPNAMWAKRPRGQLAKTAEAMALRQAFPEEAGAENTAEEMEGREVEGAAAAVDDTPAQGSGSAAEAVNAEVEAAGSAEPEPEPAPAVEHQPAETVAEYGGDGGEAAPPWEEPAPAEAAAPEPEPAGLFAE